MHVRLAVPEDTDCLLELMKGLARYEDYIDQFAVTRESILEHGFGDERLFTAFVAEHDDELVGMAVTYPIHWTYTLRPKLVLKELFVVEGARSMGVGKAFDGVGDHACPGYGRVRSHLDGHVRERRRGELSTGPWEACRTVKWNNWTLRLDT